MRPQTFLPILFCGTLLTLDAVGAMLSVNFPHPLATAVMGFCLGQAALVAGWLAFSSWSLLVRLCVVAALVTLLADVLARHSDPDRQEWMAVLTVLVAAVALPALRLRWQGARIVSAATTPDNRLTQHEPTATVPRASFNHRWQFSVGTLLVTTAAVAFVLAWSQWIRFPWGNAREVALYIVGFVAVAWMGLWSVFYRGSLTFWLVMAGVAAVAAGAGLSLVNQQDSLGIVICMLTEILIIVAGVAVLRSAGFRGDPGR